jgi:hypothetical protein
VASGAGTIKTETQLANENMNIVGTSDVREDCWRAVIHGEHILMENTGSDDAGRLVVTVIPQLPGRGITAKD